MLAPMIFIFLATHFPTLTSMYISSLYKYFYDLENAKTLSILKRNHIDIKMGLLVGLSWVKLY